MQLLEEEDEQIILATAMAEWPFVERNIIMWIPSRMSGLDAMVCSRLHKNEEQILFPKLTKMAEGGDYVNFKGHDLEHEAL